MTLNDFKINGFTIIELLVIISIIGILTAITITSLYNSREKAKDASFKSNSRTVQSAAAVCCEDSAVGSLENTLDAEICNPPMGSVYPKDTSIGSIEVARNCDDNDGFQLRLTPGSENNSGNFTYSLCDRTGCQFY